MARVRIGLFGCGQVGCGIHLNNLRRMRNVEVAALAEPETIQREAAHAQVPGAATYSDYRELLDRSDIDAVIICLPNALHADAAIAALKSGKHVYLEKPLATNLSDGARLIDACRASKQQAMIGFNYRFNPLNEEVRRQIRAGRLGQLIGARSVFTTASHNLPGWKKDRKTGGGVLLDLASHHVDLIRFWLDEPVVEVRASVKSTRVEDDTATLEMHLASGFVVQSFFCMSSVDQDRFDVYGRAGRLWVDRYKSWNVEFADMLSASRRLHPSNVLPLLRRSRFTVEKLLAPAREPSFALALAHFIETIQRPIQSHPTFEDGFRSLATVIAAEESARTGCPIAVTGLPE